MLSIGEAKISLKFSDNPLAFSTSVGRLLITFLNFFFFFILWLFLLTFFIYRTYLNNKSQWFRKFGDATLWLDSALKRPWRQLAALMPPLLFSLLPEEALLKR